MDLIKYIDIWRGHQLVGLFFISLFVAYKMYKRFGILEALLIFYCLVSSAILFQSNIQFWGKVQPRIDAVAAASFLKITALCFIAYFYQDIKKFIYLFVEFIILGSSFYLLFYKYSIFNAHSADSAMIAMIVPMILLRAGDYEIFYRSKIYLFTAAFLPLIAIVKTGGSTGYFVLFGACLALLVSTRKFWLVIFLYLIIWAGVYFNKGSFLNPETRIEQWKILFNWWMDNSDHWIGTGIGSFEWLGPMAQWAAGNSSAVFLFMHNDFLQMLFEGGYIGIFLFLLVWAKVGLNAFKTPWLFASFAAISVCMLTQFPMRWFLSQLFMTAICCEALWKKSK